MKWKSLIKELLLSYSAEHSSKHCLICKSVGVSIKTNVFFVFLETFKGMKGHHVFVNVLRGCCCFCFSFVFDREFKSEHKFPVCPYSLTHVCVTELWHRYQFHQHFTISFLVQDCFLQFFLCLQFGFVIFLAKRNW